MAKASVTLEREIKALRAEIAHLEAGSKGRNPLLPVLRRALAAREARS